MKKTVLLLFPMLAALMVYGQAFKSDKIDPAQWDPNLQLNLKTEQGQQEIRINPLGKKVKRSQKQVKYLKVNGESYQMVETCGVINILNSKGEVLLKTNRDRSEIALSQNRQITRRMLKGNKGLIEYLDNNNKVIVSGQLNGGVIELTNYSTEEQHALLALCLEELLQQAYDRYLHAMMISSFLAQTD